MKVERNIKYITIAVYTFAVIALGIALYLIASNYGAFSGVVKNYMGSMQPIIIGASLAYLVNFIMEAVEKYLLVPYLPKKFKPNTLRFFSLVITANRREKSQALHGPDPPECAFSTSALPSGNPHARAKFQGTWCRRLFAEMGLNCFAF